MDLQCFLTEIAAEGLVIDHPRRVTRYGAGADVRDSWQRSERWPVFVDAAGNIPFHAWEHMPSASPSHERSGRRQPLGALLARVQRGLRLARTV